MGVARVHLAASGEKIGVQRLLQTDQLLALYRYWCRNYGHRLDDGHVGESLCRSPVRLPQGSSCVSSVGFGLGWFRHGTFEEEVRLANESINRARFFQAEDSWAADCGATWILRHARCCLVDLLCCTPRQSSNKQSQQSLRQQAVRIAEVI